MKLELDILNIKDVRYAPKTSVSGGALNINSDELKKLLQEDNRFKSVDLELAHPGDSCRIVKVMDVIEPRAKTTSGSEDFPGVLGTQAAAGEGSTCVLRGVAVVLSDCSEERYHEANVPNGEIIDMVGPAAEFGIYGKTHNVILLAQPADGISKFDYRVALKIAGLKTAAYLARAGQNQTPDEVEVYYLPAIHEESNKWRNLPRIAYIMQILSLQYTAIPRDPVFYGANIDGIVPTILHPNEVLDGAITNPSFRHVGIETYTIQNHPIIKELYRLHGKELCFAGVILMTAYSNPFDFERSASIAASLAKWILGADAVVLTKAGGGAPEVIMSRTAIRCEKMGMKTAVAIAHLPVAKEAGILYGGKELNAIVSMGSPVMAKLQLPELARAVGRAVPTSQGKPVNQEHERLLRHIKGSFDQLGMTKLAAVQY